MRIEKAKERMNYSMEKACEAIGAGEEDEARKRLSLVYGYASLLEDWKRKRVCHSYLKNQLGYGRGRISRIRDRGIKAVRISWLIIGGIEKILRESSKTFINRKRVS